MYEGQHALVHIFYNDLFFLDKHNEKINKYVIYFT